MSENIKSLDEYQPISFFLPCELENGDIVFLELQNKGIKKYDDISHLLSDKSKIIIKLLQELTYENREVMSKLIDEKAKMLWGDDMELIRE